MVTCTSGGAAPDAAVIRVYEVECVATCTSGGATLEAAGIRVYEVECVAICTSAGAAPNAARSTPVRPVSCNAPVYVGRGRVQTSLSSGTNAPSTTTYSAKFTLGVCSIR